MLILMLDAEKASDRVFWPFIFEVCQKNVFNVTGNIARRPRCPLLFSFR